ncbi:MAG: hydrogenase assembly chaperone HypC/HupF [Candidatus Frackibacter sp. T328-2]|jgi:hydrogenase expression/formation protein HypC|nr:MAG: hydrogenase assembly chaperone HypC/HupF [Candidatus Frackibacter sp. T328-2]
MCLAVPAEVIAIDGKHAVVDLNGNRTEVGIKLVPDVEVGEYLLIHAGYAINKIDAQEAKERIVLLEEFYAGLEEIS